MSFAVPAIALVVAIGRLTSDIALSAGQWMQVIGLMWIATASVAALGTLIGLSFAAESAQNATTLAFVVPWLLGGIFTTLDSMPDALAAVSRSLPSNGLVEVGRSIAGGDPVPPSALAVLMGWTAGAGALAALTWWRVVSR